MAITNLTFPIGQKLTYFLLNPQGTSMDAIPEFFLGKSI